MIMMILMMMMMMMRNEVYGVGATTIEDKSAFAPIPCFPYVLRDRESKRA